MMLNPYPFNAVTHTRCPSLVEIVLLCKIHTVHGTRVDNNALSIQQFHLKQIFLAHFQAVMITLYNNWRLDFTRNALLQMCLALIQVRRQNIYFLPILRNQENCVLQGTLACLGSIAQAQCTAECWEGISGNQIHLVEELDLLVILV